MASKEVSKEILHFRVQRRNDDNGRPDNITYLETPNLKAAIDNLIGEYDSLDISKSGELILSNFGNEVVVEGEKQKTLDPKEIIPLAKEGFNYAAIIEPLMEVITVLTESDLKPLLPEGGSLGKISSKLISFAGMIMYIGDESGSMKMEMFENRNNDGLDPKDFIPFALGLGSFVDLSIYVRMKMMAEKDVKVAFAPDDKDRLHRISFIDPGFGAPVRGLNLTKQMTKVWVPRNSSSKFEFDDGLKLNELRDGEVVYSRVGATFRYGNKLNKPDTSVNDESKSKQRRKKPVKKVVIASDSDSESEDEEELKRQEKVLLSMLKKSNILKSTKKREQERKNKAAKRKSERKQRIAKLQEQVEDMKETSDQEDESPTQSESEPEASEPEGGNSTDILANAATSDELILNSD